MKVRNSDPLVLTVTEVAKELQLKRSKVYDLIQAQMVSAFKVGTDWRITRVSVERLATPCSELSPFDRPVNSSSPTNRW